MATNITQQYDRNIEFNTYTQAELLSDVWGELSTQWKWEGRTLSCLQLSDGTQINPGDPLTLDADYTAISGIWTMNMSPDPVKIYFIGDSGEVSVTIHEINSNAPLGGSYGLDRYGKSQVVSNIKNGQKISECSVYVYTQNGENRSNGQGGEGSMVNTWSWLNIKINKAVGTTINRVNWGGIDRDINILEWYSPNSNQQVSYNVKQWDERNYCKNQKQYGLSVFFTTQGTLTYYPNKEYVNPK